MMQSERGASPKPVRVQVGALESELRGARDVAKMRADLELERLRGESEWQRRLSAEEIARLRHLLDVRPWP